MSADLLSIEKIEADLNELIRQYFNANTRMRRFGEFNPMAFQNIYKKFVYLFQPNTMKFVKLQQENVTKYKNQLIQKMLLEYSSLFNNFVSIFSLLSKIQTRKVKLEDQKRYTLSELLNLFLKEKNREKRIKIYTKFTQKSQKLYMGYTKIIEDVYENAKLNGYYSILEMVQANNFCDFSKLRRNAEEFLVQSKSSYVSKLGLILKKVFNIEMDEVHQADVWVLIEGNWLKPTRISLNSLMENMSEITSLMGLHYANANNLYFDLEERSKKTIIPSLCFEWKNNVKINRIIINPKNENIKNFKTLFHELGHAVHYLNMNQNLSQIFQNIGEMETTETIAFLFENLLKNSNFLKQFYPSEQIDAIDYIEFMNFTKFHWTRLFAVKFLNHFHLFNQNGGYTKESFLNLQLQFDKNFIKYFDYDRMTFDHFRISDNLLLTASYLRAHLIEPQFTNKLSSLFSNSENFWWNNSKTGQYLKEKYLQHGFSKSFDEICHGIQLNPYDFKECFLK
jgi:hypothetical protein